PAARVEFEHLAAQVHALAAHARAVGRHPAPRIAVFPAGGLDDEVARVGRRPGELRDWPLRHERCNRCRKPQRHEYSMHSTLPDGGVGNRFRLPRTEKRFPTPCGSRTDDYPCDWPGCARRRADAFSKGGRDGRRKTSSRRRLYRRERVCGLHAWPEETPMTTPADLAARNKRASYNAMPGFPWTAAFKLSQEEARDIVVSYVLNSLLTLEKPVTFGADGAPTYPKIGERSTLKLDNIGGVRFVPDSTKAAAWTFTGPMDLRTAALAVRLGLYLRSSTWGVSTIFWGGMGVGRDATDRHGKGFAIDFRGAITRVGRFDVSADWGQQPITLPNGKTAREWPVNIQPYFRLDADTPARGF